MFNKEMRIAKNVNPETGEVSLRMPCEIVNIRHKDGVPQRFTNKDGSKVNTDTNQTSTYFKATVEWVTNKVNKAGEYIIKKSNVVAYIGQNVQDQAERLENLLTGITPLDDSGQKTEFLLQSEKDDNGNYYLRLSHLEFADGQATDDDFGELAMTADEVATNSGILADTSGVEKEPTA